MERSLGRFGRWPHWSQSEKFAGGILLSVLAFFSVIGLSMLFSIGGCGSPGNGAPCGPIEGLNIESVTMNSPTSVTLKLVNTGIKTVSLIAYYVKNTNGTTYSDANWSGPSLVPNAVWPIDILIDGKDFTFEAHNTYTVLMVTGRSQFTFTVQL